MRTIKGVNTCDCGHVESYHSEHTTGYGTDRETGKTFCYDCCLKNDLKTLAETGKLSAYVSCDGKTVTTWPGNVIADITGCHVVNFGYCRNQLSFDAVTSDGLRLSGRGPGTGMYCRLRVKNNKKVTK